MTEEEFVQKVKSKNWEFTFREWRTFSKTPQTREDIILRAICNTNLGHELLKHNKVKKKEINCLCYSFLCATQEFDEELIKELSLISSKLFTFDRLSNPRYVEIAFELMNNRLPELSFGEVTNKEILSMIEESHNLEDKLDWYELLKNPKAHISSNFKKDNCEYIHRMLTRNTRIANTMCAT